MEKLQYKDWIWPENPETFLIGAARTPEYTRAEDGTMTYNGMGQLCRTISGKGVFHGENAAAAYKALAAFLGATEAGALVHPVWGSINALLTELRMEEDSRENWIVYAYTFQEVDSDGTIPLLTKPSNWVIVTV